MKNCRNMWDETRYIWSYQQWLNEGIRQGDSGYEFSWNVDSPDDLMSLHLQKHSGRTQKFADTEMRYSYYYAYHLDKSVDSGQLMKNVKLLDASIGPNDAKLLVNKAVQGFEMTFGIGNYNAIVSPVSSSLILTELTQQLAKKNGNIELFDTAFVKAASADVQLDMDAVNKISSEKTKKDILRAYRKVVSSNMPFKIRDIYSAHRKFFRDYLLFNRESDRHLFNSVSGHKVILVDDFRTSGTTIKEMLRKLSEVGTQEVVVFILIKLS